MCEKIIEFGSYQQTSLEKEPLKWIVISEKEDSKFLLSEKCLDVIPYLNVKKNEVASTDWEKSYIRKWLNSNFYDNAFNDDEKHNIKATRLQSVCEEAPLTSKKQNYNSLAKVITTDNVFVLNEKEIDEYIKDKNILVASNTDLVSKKLKSTIGNWWLRDIGYFDSDAKIVDTNGIVHNSNKKDRCTVDVRSPLVAVRPAIIIKKSIAYAKSQENDVKESGNNELLLKK